MILTVRRANRGAVLVTGGAGFIGSHAARTLAKSGERILVCDPVTGPVASRNLADVPVETHVAPAALAGFLKAEGAHVGAIIHMGAISATTETNVARIIENNVTLSQDLWRFAATAGVPFIYASSAATYGSGAEGFDDVFEASAMARLRPLNIYGWSKLVFDRWVEAELRAGRASPPQWAGLRFFNVYGSHEEHKGPQSSVVSQLLPKLARGEAARLFRSHRPDYADGGQLRDFVYVGDCVGVINWLLSSGVSGLFNVGTGRARSFLDLARACFAALGLPEKIDFIDMPEALRAQYQYYTQANVSRLKAAGYPDAFTALEDGVAACARAFRKENP